MAASGDPSAPGINPLGVNEAAQACGVSVDTVRRRLREGHFPSAARIDGRWQIPLEDLRLSDMLDLECFEALTEGTAIAADRSKEREEYVQLISAYEAHIEDLRTELTRLHHLLSEAMRCRGDA